MTNEDKMVTITLTLHRDGSMRFESTAHSEVHAAMRAHLILGILARAASVLHRDEYEQREQPK